MKESQKVLFCINKLGSGSSVGGAERLVVDDINEMLRRGYTVNLLTLKNESQFSLADELKLDKKYWQTVNFGLPNILSWIKVYKYIKNHKSDVVFTHLWFSNAVIRIVCKIAGVKNVVAFEHNVYDTVKTRKMYMADRFLQKWCKKIVAVSGAVKKSLLEHGIKESRIMVINNGIDVSKYKKEKNLGLKERLGIPDDAFVFLTISRLIHQKGVDILLKAFAKLSDSPVLLVIGSGSDENMLKNLAEQVGISDRVYFLGTRHDIPDVLSICNCFVLASRWEGLGIAVLEAMASKKPIIISDFEAGKDMITNNLNGLVVPKEDEESLSKAMNTLILDKDSRDRLAQSAYETVQEFSIQNHVNKILSL